MTDLQDVTGLVRGGCAAELSRQLAASHQSATLLLEALAGCRLRLEVLRSGTRPMTGHEQGLLWSEPGDCRWRTSLLRGPRLRVAAIVRLVWLPARLPADAAEQLDAAVVPAGVVLARFGMRRIHQLSALGGGTDEDTGLDIAVRSAAVLEVGGRLVGVAEERITAGFVGQVAGPGRSARARQPGGHGNGSGPRQAGGPGQARSLPG